MERKPPGWYQDPRSSSWLRWWDGDAWTDQYELNRDRSDDPARTQSYSTQTPSAQPWAVAAPARRATGRWWIVALVVGTVGMVGLSVFGIVVMASGGGRNHTTATTFPTMPDFGSEEQPPLSTAPTAGAAPGPVTAPSLVIVGDVAIPDGTPGEVSVVLLGRPTRQGVPVVVRNMTGDTVVNIRVTLTARGTDGALVSVGRTQQTMPYAVAPGEWAFTYVDILEDIPPPDTEFETELGYDPYRPGVDAPLGVIEEVVRQDDARFGIGITSSRLIGTVTNPTGESLVNGMGISVLCMSGSAIDRVFGGSTLGYGFEAGATVPFVALMPGSGCDHFAVGAQPLDLAHQMQSVGS